MYFCLIAYLLVVIDGMNICLVVKLTVELELIVAHCNVAHLCTEYVDNALHKQFDDFNLEYACN